MKQIFFLLFFGLGILYVFGQNEREVLVKYKQIKVERPEIQIDTFSIQPDFFEIFDNDNIKIPKSEYNVDFVQAKVFFKNFEKFKNQTFTIFYAVYPERYRKTYQKFVLPEQSGDSLLLPVFSTPNISKRKPFGNLKTEGNLRRGVNIGNNQSLVMQSGMDLKIEGKLSKNIKLKAVLSDDNLPQAYAGISKSYKDFNRIYIQLNGNQWQATGGDLILKNQNSRFLKYQRKIQGLAFETGKNNKVSTKAGIVDGQYNRMQFAAQEGNSGPYLLKGKNNETYIFVIPESEKIYLNGNLLNASQDYTINYETGELIFKPTINLTANDRITAEFNYSNQNYIRYLNENSYTKNLKNGQLKIFTFLSQDDRNKTLLFNFTPEQVQALKNAGDNSGQLYILSAKPSAYNENKILYKKVISGNDFYFEYTDQDEPDLYEVRFSYAGKNLGSYAIDQIIALGKIYKYVGAGNGDYEPKIKLTPPVSSKYIGINYHKKLSDKDFFSSEMVFNHTDLNTFSPIDDKNNLGGASHILYERNIVNDSLKNWKVFGEYNFIHQNFIALDPYYDPEFKRRWQLDSIFGRQHFLNFGTSFQNKNDNWNSGFKYFQLRDNIRAGQIYFEGSGQLKKIRWQAQNRLTRQSNSIRNLLWIDTDNKISIPIKKWNWLNTLHLEKKSAQNQNYLDTLNFAYRYWETGFAKKDSGRLSVQAGFRLSANDSVLNNRLQLARKSVGGFVKIKKLYSTGNIKLYFNLKNIQNVFQNHFERLITFQTQIKQYFYKRVFTGTFDLETYNGNVLQNEIVYVETLPGQGNYQWNDYNGNGIKEINEFEPAVFSDQARYIRVVLPSKNLLPTLNNKYGLEWIINPSALSKKSFWQHIYNRSFWYNAYQIKQEGNGKLWVWQPTDALLNNYRYGNELIINRGAKKYNLHLLWEKTGNEQLLVIGKQALYIENRSLQTRHFFSDTWLWQQKFAWVESERYSENYPTKNYKLSEKKMEQDISFIQVKKSDLKLFYQYKFKQNHSGSERLKSQVFGLSYATYPQKKSSFHTSFRFVNNDFSGNDTTPVAFQMLEGLQKGKNLLLELNYRQRLTTYLELNLNYNFRVSENNPVIHTGGILLKMIF